MEKTILICLSLIFTTGLCYFDDGLLPPGPVYGAVGEKVVFNTIITPLSTPLLVVVWNFNTAYNIIVSDTTGNNTAPAYRNRVSVNIYTGALELRDLTLDDSGYYRLIIVNQMAVTLRHDTTLRVFEKISGVSLTGPAKPLTEDQNSVVLTCEGTGSIITTEWMKDGQPLSPSDNIIFSADLRSVSISPVRRSDSGEYQCRLSNPVSSETATYTMTVNDGPENVSISGQNEVEVGSKTQRQ